MKSATSVYSSAPALARPRLADYVELARPRVAFLVLFTVAIGACLASVGMPEWLPLLHALFGTALVASGASALNQLFERHSDALMLRTENRPLPAGRLAPVEGFVFGMGLGIVGSVYLALTLRSPAAALVASFTFLSYVFVYTPLKRVTTLNTLIGAVPGALPPVIGWVAVRGRIDAQALALFAILYLWQVPHFLAIAWIYKEDYGRAGLCMLPVFDATGSDTGRQMVRYSLVLIPVSLLPTVLGLAGLVYAAAAVLLGLGFLRASWRFLWDPSLPHARRVMRASLIYLPLLFLFLLLDSAALGAWYRG
ncbi:MAG: heme o synthase [Gemmataceae bacterium]